jgi:hypothetical protein
MRVSLYYCKRRFGAVNHFRCSGRRHPPRGGWLQTAPSAIRPLYGTIPSRIALSFLYNP